VNLSWSASTDNVGVTGYRVFRNGAQVGTPSGLAFQDVGLTPNTTYNYTVAARDAAGNVSSQSASASATTSLSSIGSALPPRLAQSTGTVFYVAPNGANTNAGTIDAPWQTIQKALNTLQPGQKAYVRAGTYREALTMSRAGTAAAPITIEAYPGDQPIIDAELVRRPLVIQSNAGYFRIKGFILDRDCCTSGGHIDVYGHHIEIIDNEMRNGKGKGVYTDESSSFVHIIGNWIHNNSTAGGQQDHGIYLQGDDHFVANNVIHDHPDGFGIQAYDKGSRYVIVNNTVTNNGHSGIVVGGSGGVSNVTIRNNILANNNYYGVQMDSSCPTSNVVIENNVIFGNSSGAVEGGCPSVSVSGTIAANPLFVNPGSSGNRNLRVQSGSPAINAGRADFATPTAFGGAARDGQPDIGAYEFGTP
jgi:chitodextrinase